jgi:thymidylate kinase
MSNVTVVEFIGPPGAGKSTLVRLVQDSLESLGYRIFDVCGKSLQQLAQHDSKTGMARLMRSLPDKLNMMLFYLGCPFLPVKILRFACSIHSSDPWVPKLALIMLKQAYTVTRLKQIAEAQNYDIILYDQAVVQTIWSMLVHGKELPEKDLRRIIASLQTYLAPLLIYCHLDSRTAYQRITGRGATRCRFSKMDKETALTLLADKIPYFTNLERLVEELCGCTVLTVDTDQETSTAREQIVRFVMEVMHKEKCLEH